MAPKTHINSSTLEMKNSKLHRVTDSQQVTKCAFCLNYLLTKTLVKNFIALYYLYTCVVHVYVLKSYAEK